LNATTEDGRKSAANHFLIDQLIREFCEEEWLLDFEGSDLEGVKHFYQSFIPPINLLPLPHQPFTEDHAMDIECDPKKSTI